MPDPDMVRSEGGTVKRKTFATDDSATEALIVRVPGVRGGDQVIKGSRITVTDIVRRAWRHADDILLESDGLQRPSQGDRLLTEPLRSLVLQRILGEDYPHLSKEQVLAAWTYFVKRNEEVSLILDEEDACVERHKPRE